MTRHKAFDDFARLVCGESIRDDYLDPSRWAEPVHCRLSARWRLALHVVLRLHDLLSPILIPESH